MSRLKVYETLDVEWETNLKLESRLNLSASRAAKQNLNFLYVQLIGFALTLLMCCCKAKNEGVACLTFCCGICCVVTRIFWFVTTYTIMSGLYLLRE